MRRPAVPAQCMRESVERLDAGEKRVVEAAPAPATTLHPFASARAGGVSSAQSLIAPVSSLSCRCVRVFSPARRVTRPASAVVVEYTRKCAGPSQAFAPTATLAHAERLTARGMPIARSSSADSRSRAPRRRTASEGGADAVCCAKAGMPAVMQHAIAVRMRLMMRFPRRNRAGCDGRRRVECGWKTLRQGDLATARTIRPQRKAKISLRHEGRRGHPVRA